MLLVGPGEELQSGSSVEAIATAFDQAMNMTRDPASVDLGYPWLDPATGELVLSAVTATGRTLLEARTFGMPTRIRSVTHGVAELEKIQDAVTRLLGQGVPDAALIYQVGPDWRDNRMAISIGRFSRPLLDALAARFPPDALAVIVDPGRYPLRDSPVP